MPAVARRAAVDADEPFLRALYASTRPEVSGWPDDFRDAFLAQQFDAQRRGWGQMFPGSRHDILLVGGSAVGRLWVHWTGNECLIVDIALVPEHRRRGVGTAVVDEVLAEADRTGVPVRAHVERANVASLAFWLRFGFREVGGDELFAEILRPVSI